MNEEMLQSLYGLLGLEEDKVSLDQFKSDMEGNREMQDAVMKKLGLYDKGVTLEQFQSDLNPQQATPQPLDGRPAGQPAQGEGETDFLDLGFLNDTELGDWIQDTYRAGKRGVASGAGLNESIAVIANGAKATDDDFEKMIQSQEDTRAIGVSDEMKDFLDSEKKWGLDGSFWRNPITLVTEWVVETFTALGRGGAGIIAASAATGAAVGSLAAPVIGTGLGVAGGVVTGTAVTGGALEAVSKFVESAQEKLASEGLEFNKDNLKILSQNDEWWEETRTTAIKKGATITAVDLVAGIFTAGVGGKVGRAITGGATKTVRGLKSTALESVSGAFGEGLSSKVIGEDLDWDNIKIEGIAGAGQGLPNTTINVIRDSNKAIQDVRKGKDPSVNVAKAAVSGSQEDFNNAVAFALEQGSIDEAQAESLKASYEESTRVNGTVPDRVDGLDTRAEVVAKISQRDQINAELEAEKAKPVDEAFADEANPRIAELEAEKAKLNDEIKNTSKPVTETTNELTQDAEDLLSDLDEFIPDFISNTMKRIGEKNGIAVTPEMTPKDFIDALKSKREVPVDSTPRDGRQNTEFFTDKSKEASSKIPYTPVIEVDKTTPVAKAYDIFTAVGNFTGHISKMIPGFQEKQKQVAEAITKGPFKSFLDLGASEGGLIKTVSSVNPAIRSVGVDPNSQMKANFESTPAVEGAEFRQEAFLGSWVDADGTVINEFKTDEKFDVVNEDFTFQFINNDRAGQVKAVKELMTPDGIFVTSEKFDTSNNENNEAKKLDHQSKYFNQDQLTEDKQTIITGMGKDMVADVDYFNTLKDNFKYVEEFWNAGNFKGYLASDNKQVIDTFKENVGNLETEFTDNSSRTSKSQLDVKSAFAQESEQNDNEAIDINNRVTKEDFISRVKSKVDMITNLATRKESGDTFDFHGSRHEGGGLIIPVVSENTTQLEITPEKLADFAERHSDKIGDRSNVRVGIYKFPNSNQVAMDISIVVDPKHKKAAIEFGKLADQESLFDLTSSENIKTGGTGQNPVNFTPAQFKQIATDLAEGKVPDVFGDTTEAVAEGTPVQAMSELADTLVDAFAEVVGDKSLTQAQLSTIDNSNFAAVVDAIDGDDPRSKAKALGKLVDPKTGRIRVPKAIKAALEAKLGKPFSEFMKDIKALEAQRKTEASAKFKKKPETAPAPPTPVTPEAPKSDTETILSESANALPKDEFLTKVHTVPLKDLDPNFPQETVDKIKSRKSKSPGAPVVVGINEEGKFTILDGAHRYYEKLANGDTTIDIRFARDEGVESFHDNINNQNATQEQTQAQETTNERVQEGRESNLTEETETVATQDTIIEETGSNKAQIADQFTRFFAQDQADPEGVGKALSEILDKVSKKFGFNIKDRLPFIGQTTPESVAQIENNLITPLKRLRDAQTNAKKKAKITELIDLLRSSQIDPAFQSNDKVRGALIESARGQALLLALDSPNPSTAIHEIFHIMEPYFSADQKGALVTAFQEAGGTITDPSGLTPTESRDVSEYGARLWEDYWKSGRDVDSMSQTIDNKSKSAVKKLLDKMTQVMRDLYVGVIKYRTATGDNLVADISLSPRVQQLFDQILETGIEPTPAEVESISTSSKLINSDIDVILRDFKMDGFDKTIPVGIEEAINEANDRGYLSRDLSSESAVRDDILSSDVVDVNEYKVIALARGISKTVKKIRDTKAHIKKNKDGNVTKLLEMLADQTDQLQLYGAAYKQVGTTTGRALVYRRLMTISDFMNEDYKNNIRKTNPKLTEKDLKKYDKLAEELEALKEEYNVLLDQMEDAENQALTDKATNIYKDGVDVKKGKKPKANPKADFLKFFGGGKVKYSSDTNGTSKYEVIQEYVKHLIREGIVDPNDFNGMLDRVLADYNSINNKTADLSKMDIVKSILLTKESKTSEYQKRTGQVRSMAKLYEELDRAVAGGIEKVKKNKTKPAPSMVQDINKMINDLLKLENEIKDSPATLAEATKELMDLKTLIHDAFFKGISPDTALIKELSAKIKALGESTNIRLATMEAQLKQVRAGQTIEGGLTTKKAKETKILEDSAFRVMERMNALRDDLKIEDGKLRFQNELRDKYKGARNILGIRKSTAAWNNKIMMDWANLWEMPRRYLFGGDASFLLLQSGFHVAKLLGRVPTGVLTEGGRTGILNDSRALYNAIMTMGRTGLLGFRQDRQGIQKIHDTTMATKGGAFATQMGLDLPKPFSAIGLKNDEFFKGAALGELKSDHAAGRALIALADKFDAVSEGTYLSYLNSLKLEVFNNFVKSNQNLTLPQIQEYAKRVNIEFGRSNTTLGPFSTATIAAPRYYHSRILLARSLPGAMINLAKNPNNPVARRIALDNAYFVNGMVLAGIGLSGLGWDYDEDPRSSTFLKYRKGDEVMDLTAGMGKWIDIAGKFTTYFDERVIGTDVVGKLMGPRPFLNKQNDFLQNPTKVLMNKVSYSLHPSISKAVFEPFTGENIIGQPLGLTKTQVLSHYLIGASPLGIQPMIKAAVDETELGIRIDQDRDGTKALDRISGGAFWAGLQEIGLNRTDYDNNLKHVRVEEHLNKILFNPAKSFTKTQIRKIFLDLDESSFLHRQIMDTYRLEVLDATGTEILKKLNLGETPTKNGIKSIIRSESLRLKLKYKDKYNI